MRPEDFIENYITPRKGGELKKPAARIETTERAVTTIQKVKHVVLELTPEEAQTIFAVANFSSTVIGMITLVGASSDNRKALPGAENHLISVFRKLNKVVNELYPDALSGFVRRDF